MDVPEEITTDSPTYSPPGSDSANHHYLLRQMTVDSSGEYSIRSSSAFPTQGYVYANNFNPSRPTENIIAQARSDANGQLQLTVDLEGSNQRSKRVCTYLSMKRTLTKSFTLFVSSFLPNALHELTTLSSPHKTPV